VADSQLGQTTDPICRAISNKVHSLTTIFRFRCKQ